MVCVCLAQPTLMFDTLFWTLGSQPFYFWFSHVEFNQVLGSSPSRVQFALSCAWNPFGREARLPRPPQGANPKCKENKLSAKVPSQCLCAQLFQGFTFKFGYNDAIPMPLRPNINFPSLFTLDTKALGQHPCAQPRDPYCMWFDLCNWPACLTFVQHGRGQSKGVQPTPWQWIPVLAINTPFIPCFSTLFFLASPCSDPSPSSPLPHLFHTFLRLIQAKQEP